MGEKGQAVVAPNASTSVGGASASPSAELLGTASPGGAGSKFSGSEHPLGSPAAGPEGASKTIPSGGLNPVQINPGVGSGLAQSGLSGTGNQASSTPLGGQSLTSQAASQAQNAASAASSGAGNPTPAATGGGEKGQMGPAPMGSPSPAELAAQLAAAK